jgi:hypothetical protein
MNFKDVSELPGVRLFAFVAVLTVGGVWAVHLKGPAALQEPVDRVIVSPLVKSTAAAGVFLGLVTADVHPKAEK